MTKLTKKFFALLLALLLLVLSLGSAGAYWTADPGPSPARCGYWANQIAQGGASAASAQRYFDRYHCVWVDESE